MIRVHLKRGEDRRIRTGHLWVFSNEIARIEGPAGEYEPGVAAQLVSAGGDVVGCGYYNRNSLIAFRLLARTPEADPAVLLPERIRTALEFRQTIHPDGTCYRLVYGEGDLLPGLIVDRYGDHLSVQLTTAGMERLRPQVLDALEAVVHPAGIVLRNDSSIRKLEGLPGSVEVARGAVEGPVRVMLDGLALRVDLVGGQKTGLFLDQRENRLALGRYVRGRSVLDVFCHQAAWGLMALSAGAREATGVDSSAPALELARQAAADNGLADRFQAVQGDAFEVLERMASDGETRDVVVLDPPAFARSQKDVGPARKAYERINRLALKVLRPGGILATCSCSYHVSTDEFLDTVARAVSASGRTARLLELRGQPPDHAGLLVMPEAEYLKCAFLQILGAPGR